METRTRIGMLAFTLVTCLGVLFAPVSSAGDRTIKIHKFLWGLRIAHLHDD